MYIIRRMMCFFRRFRKMVEGDYTRTFFRIGQKTLMRQNAYFDETMTIGIIEIYMKIDMILVNQELIN